MTLITRNKLCQVSFFKLCKHIEELPSKTILSNKKVAASCISIDLGFLVTEANIEAAMHATGVTVPRPEKSTFKAKAKFNGKKEANVSHTTRTIARSLLSLCQDLGHKPRNIDALARIAEYEIEDGGA